MDEQEQDGAVIAAGVQQSSNESTSSNHLQLTNLANRRTETQDSSNVDHTDNM